MFDVSGKFPYPSRYKVPPLPDLRNTGDQRGGGMFHLAGLCPKHSIEFETKMFTVMNYSGETSSADSDNSGDNMGDHAVVPGDESSISSEEMFTQKVIPKPPTKRATKKAGPVTKEPPARSACPPSRKKQPLKSTRPLSPHKLPPPVKSAKPAKRKQCDDSSDDDHEVLALTLKKRRPNEPVS